MNLLIDLGNSRLKWAAQDAQSWRMGALAYEDPIERAWTQAWRELRPDAVILCSVGPEWVTDQLVAWVRVRWDLRVTRVRAQAEGYGLRNHYEEPETLGADRWVALVAARARYQGRLCVVDCGTAVTVDALSETGEFLGGAILPGFAAMRRGLNVCIPSLPATGGRDDDCLARTTADGVATGTHYAVVGAVERLLEEYERTLGAPLPVVLTGGDAGLLVPDLRYAVTEVPDLVLRGLALMAGWC